MSETHGNEHASLIPPKPMPAGAEAFTRSVQGLLDGHAKGDAEIKQALYGLDEMLDIIAAGLYSLASMLVGEGEESVRLVEHTISTAEVTRCGDHFEARRSSRLPSPAASPAAWLLPRAKLAPPPALKTTIWIRPASRPRNSSR
ncbi:MAG: hypothetical protein ABR928_22360 [Terracidiphilus sp.]